MHFIANVFFFLSLVSIKMCGGVRSSFTYAKYGVQNLAPSYFRSRGHEFRMSTAVKRPADTPSSLPYKKSKKEVFRKFSLFQTVSDALCRMTLFNRISCDLRKFVSKLSPLSEATYTTRTIYSNFSFSLLATQCGLLVWSCN